jgi:lipopolysaccharide export system protein LptA
MNRRVSIAALAALGLAFGTGAAAAQQAGASPPAPKPAQPAAQRDVKPKDAGRAGVLGNLGSTKEPIKIDADRLDVFDKESRAVFSGNVVSVQGESTMRCTTLTVFYEQQRGKGAERAAGSQGDAIKQILCAGPVTVVSKDQIATGDNATFDRVANKVVLTGNVALSQCQNVTRGERIVYDLNSGVANVETAPGGRVRALFVPGGGDDQAKQGCAQAAAGPAPAAAPQAATAQPKPAPKPRAQTN